MTFKKLLHYKGRKISKKIWRTFSLLRLVTSLVCFAFNKIHIQANIRKIRTKMKK